MKRILLGASALAMTAGAVSAGGLDRSGQSMLAIFDADNTGAFTYGYVEPSVTGKDAAGNKYDVGESYNQFGFSYTRNLTPQFNYSLIYDQPFGADVDYGNDPLTSALGGTYADLNSQALTFLGRYKVNDRFSVFAGLRAEQVDAEVGLNGTAYANAISTARVAGANGLDAGTLGAALAGDPAAIAAVGGPAALPALGAQFVGTRGAFNANGGYDFKMEADTQPGYVIGAAYEIPDIALRFVATYSFELQHKADTTEEIFGTTIRDEVEYVTPQSLNLEFQTGIAAGTLLTAGYRWTDFSAVDVVPTALNSDLVNLEDSHRYSLGVARQFNDKFAGSISISYEPETGDDTVSPLGPTDGLLGVTIGMRYVDGPFNLSAGINYSKLGDADAGVADRSAAEFRDNSAVGIGFRAQMTF